MEYWPIYYGLAGLLVPLAPEEMQEQELKANLVTFASLLGCQPAAAQLSQLFEGLEQVLKARFLLENAFTVPRRASEKRRRGSKKLRSGGALQLQGSSDLKRQLFMSPVAMDVAPGASGAPRLF